ncbi:MAG: type 4a pilus biogenesis protein PilO [Patescibacteria group bacterium]|nr:type 4a pilus biogenesis protein PilO [Patescibacteria group bacterium]
MNKVEKKLYIKAGILLAVVLALLYVSCFYFPQKIEDLSSEIINNKKQIKQLNEQSNQIDDIRNKHDKLRENVDEALECIISYSNIFSFITNIKDIAKRNNVDLNINVSSNGKTKETNFLSYINYNIKAVGEFGDIMRFLDNLENLKYYINVEKIKISSNGNNSGKVTFDSVLKVYVRD